MKITRISIEDKDFIPDEDLVHEIELSEGPAARWTVDCACGWEFEPGVVGGLLGFNDALLVSLVLDAAKAHLEELNNMDAAQVDVLTVKSIDEQPELQLCFLCGGNIAYTLHAPEGEPQPTAEDQANWVGSFVQGFGWLCPICIERKV